jgi:hypothetical protein
VSRSGPFHQTPAPSKRTKSRSSGA